MSIVLFSIILILILLLFFSWTGFLSVLKLRFVDSFYGEGSYFHSIYFSSPVYSEHSPYQHIMILQSPFYGKELHLDGKIQVSEKASITYHEYLALPAFAASKNPKKVLLIGGGDGGALYQLLKFNVEIDHVDLDERVIEVSKEYLPLVHRGSLDDERVNRVIGDGRIFLKNTKDKTYDIIIIDLPNPTKLPIAALYSKEFYQEVKRALSDDGILSVQVISPYLYFEAFSSIYKTIASVFSETHPYVVPGSLYGSHGFIVASEKDPRDVQNPEIEGIWYDVNQHESMFMLQKFVQENINSSSIQISTDLNPIAHMYMQNNYFYRGVADNPAEGR